MTTHAIRIHLFRLVLAASIALTFVSTSPVFASVHGPVGTTGV